MGDGEQSDTVAAHSSPEVRGQEGTAQGTGTEQHLLSSAALGGITELLTDEETEAWRPEVLPRQYCGPGAAAVGFPPVPSDTMAGIFSTLPRFLCLFSLFTVQISKLHDLNSVFQAF